MTGNDDVAAAVAVADELGFRLDRSAVRIAVDAADELANAAETVVEPSDPTVDSDGTPGHLRLDDDNGALLWGYETPRRVGDGPLSDLDIAIKDNVAVSGLPLTCGTDSLEYTPTFDATLVERLLADGAGLVGKANMDAFAFGPSGEFSGVTDVRNPIDSSRIPGGSSSGSGVAVAAGDVDAAIGTDTGGSVRIPAACCGAVGIKPSAGAVSRHGIVPFAPSLDTAGPIAHTVENAYQVLKSIRGSDIRDATTGPPGQREEIGNPVDDLVVGVPTDFLETCSEPVYDTVVNATEELGSVADFQPVELPLGAIEEAYLLIGATEFSWWLRQRGTVRGVGSTYAEGWARSLSEFVSNGGLSEHIAKRVLPSAYLDATENGEPYRAARREARAFAGRVDTALAEVNVLCVPTIRTLPLELGAVTANDRLFDLLGNTAPFNLSGHPAVSVPIDAVNDLPVSVQFIAAHGADDLAVDAAATVETVVNESDSLTPPDLPV